MNGSSTTSPANSNRTTPTKIAGTKMRWNRSVNRCVGDGLGLRLCDQSNNPGQRGVTGKPGDLDLDGAGAVDRAGEDPRRRVDAFR